MRHSTVRLIYAGGENNPVGLAAIKKETGNHQREPPSWLFGLIYLLAFAVYHDSSTADDPETENEMKYFRLENHLSSFHMIQHRRSLTEISCLTMCDSQIRLTLSLIKEISQLASFHLVFYGRHSRRVIPRRVGFTLTIKQLYFNFHFLELSAAHEWDSQYHFTAASSSFAAVVIRSYRA